MQWGKQWDHEWIHRQARNTRSYMGICIKFIYLFLTEQMEHLTKKSWTDEQHFLTILNSGLCWSSVSAISKNHSRAEQEL